MRNNLKFYLFPLALLWLEHNISQFLESVDPPLLHALTWSASISLNFQILFLLELSLIAHRGQFETPSISALFFCLL